MQQSGRPRSILGSLACFFGGTARSASTAMMHAASSRPPEVFLQPAHHHPTAPTNTGTAATRTPFPAMFVRQLARPLAAAAGRRGFASPAGVKYGRDFQTTWLGDKGAWPVLVIIGGALVFCGTFIGKKLALHPDVRITASKRASDIRTWE